MRMVLLLAVVTSALFISATRSDQHSPELPTKSTSGLESLDAKQMFRCDQLPLHLAVASRDLTNVLNLLANGSDMYATDCSGMSPMHIAVLHPKEEIILALLEKSFDLNRFFNVTGTVLEFAIRNAVYVVSDLMRMGGNINETFSPKGESYIHRAVASGHFSFTKNLIQLGADLEVADWSNITPIEIAVSKNNPAMLNLLVAAGVKTNTGYLLRLAVKNNSTDCLQRLLGRGLPVDSVDEDGDTPIVLAVREDNKAIAEILLDFKADLKQRKDGKTLLDIALQNKNSKCLRLLLQRGLKIGDGGKLMQAAVERDDVEALKTLTEFGLSVNVDQGGRNMLHYSAEKGSVSCIRWLLQQGLDVNNKTFYGPLGKQVTPLHEAVWNNHLPAVELLVESGACINCNNPFGLTPLDIAYYRKFRNIVAYFEKQMLQQG